VSAPQSVHQSARRHVALVVEREYQPDPARCVAAIVKLLMHRPTNPPSAVTHTADHRRPPSASQSEGGRPSDSLPTKKAAPLPGHGPSDSPHVLTQGEVSG
jgi:hypothetical protein